MNQQAEGTRRVRMNRDRVLDAAVTLADETGIEALSMRRLAQELDVVPMALYKHVASKEELLDGMVERIIREIEPPSPTPTGRRPCANACSRRAVRCSAIHGPGR